MKNNKLFSLLCSSDFLVINKEIIRLFGRTSAILLSAIIEEMRKQKKNDFFLFTIQMMEDATTLSQFEQYYALEKLKEKGIIETKLIGFPSRRYIKFNADVLMNLLKIDFSKDTKEPPKENKENESDIKLFEVANDDATNHEIELMQTVLKKGNFCHKLPKVGEQPTKTFNDIREIVSKLVDHTFTGLPFNSSWTSQLNIEKVIQKIFKVSNLDEAYNLIMQSLDIYLPMFDDGNFPANKNTLTNKLTDYLYNWRTGKSWFVYCLSNSVETVAAHEGKNIPLPQGFLEALKYWDCNSMHLKNYMEKHKAEFAIVLVNLDKWYLKTRKKLALELYGYEDIANDAYNFWSDYLEFLVDLTDDGTPVQQHFAVDGKTHKRWLCRFHED